MENMTYEEEDILGRVTSVVADDTGYRFEIRLKAPLSLQEVVYMRKTYYRDIVKHLLTALYELPECGCGGIAHIVTDDLNTRDDDLAFVLKQCEIEPHRIEVPLVRCLMEYLRRFGMQERSDLIHEWWTDRAKGNI